MASKKSSEILKIEKDQKAQEKVKQKSVEKSNGRGRTRSFATVVYEESAPEDWQTILSDQFVPAFISPYHNKDVNPTGEVKKPHWHVLLMFDSVKTVDQAQNIFNLIGGVGCETVNSLRGYARYLCHLDNPDKYQYPQEDVRCLCGSDYANIIGLAIDRYKAISEMIEWCVLNGVVSFSDLIIYSKMERFDWFRILCDNGTIIMREFLKSKHWTEQAFEQKGKDDV